MNILMEGFKICMVWEEVEVVFKVKLAEKLEPCVVRGIVLINTVVLNLSNFMKLEQLLVLLYEMIILFRGAIERVVISFLSEHCWSPCFVIIL